MHTLHRLLAVATQQFSCCLVYIYVWTLRMCNIMMMNRVKDARKSEGEIQNDCLNCEMEKSFLWNPTKWFYRSWSWSNITGNRFVGNIDTSVKDKEDGLCHQTSRFLFYPRIQFEKHLKNAFQMLKGKSFPHKFSIENQSFLFRACGVSGMMCAQIRTVIEINQPYLVAFWACNDKTFLQIALTASVDRKPHCLLSRKNFQGM